MKIKSIELTNWGPHKHLLIDSDTPVFGLLGPNGSGKTNILEALNFAFTGMLTRSQDEYVRRSSAEDAKNNGSVKVVFEKDRLEGSIFRQVGTSPRRELKWDGKVWKKVSEVDHILAEVLNCDKKAINLAVFLSQGKIGDFLFSTLAVREPLLATMCLVDHLPKVAEIVDEKIFILKHSIADHSAVRDAIRDEVSAAHAIADMALQDYKSMPDRSVDIKWWDARSQYELTLVSARSASQVAAAAKLEAEGRLRELQPLPFVEGEVTSWIENQLSILARQSHIAKSLEEARAKIEHRKELVNRRSVLLDEINQIYALIPQLGAVNDALRKTEEDMAKRMEFDRRSEVLARLTADLDVRRKELENARQRLQVARASAEAIAGEGSHEAAEERLNLLRQQTALLLTLKTDLKLDCCPLCKSKDLSGLEELRSQLPALQEEVSRLQTEIRVRQHREETARTELRVAESDLQNAVRQVESAEVGFQAAKQAVAEFPEPPVVSQEDLQELRRRKDVLFGKTSPLESKQVALGQLNKDLEGYPTEEVLAAEIENLQKEVVSTDGIHKQVETARRWVSRRDQLNVELSRAEGAVCEANNRIVNATSQLNEHDKLKPSSLKVGTDTRESMEAHQKLRASKFSAWEENVKAARRQEEKLAEIDKKIERQNELRSLLGQLEELKGLFSRFGIQRHYLMRVFDKLGEATKENLANWEDDFQIMVDPEKPFNFLFSRGNDPDVWLDQSQLSGGQRIRLSISFLLAVQQLVVPELNFLVLDEPSTHLDEQGVEGLGKLFRTMNQLMTGDGAQVIVVDHHKDLRSSFQKSLTLKPVEDT